MSLPSVTATWEADGVSTNTLSSNAFSAAATQDPEVVDPDDVETLEDLVVAALNEVFKKIDAEQASVYGKMTGGMGGLGGGLF